jgi:hypothetical protein
MTSHTIGRFAIAAALVASSAAVSAQALLPSVPPRQFGGSVTPVFEGWYDNADGTHTFLIGYFSRNTKAELDVPLGPNNRFEPGTLDMGQPTHFLPGRRYGMFTVTVPKDFPKTQKISWVLTVNGVTCTVPFYMSPDYNLSPFKASEESAGGGYNLPPLLKVGEQGQASVGPIAQAARATSRTATAGVPLSLDLWADDDARYSSGGSAPMRNPPPPVTAIVSKYRGPGTVTFSDARPAFEVLKGGKPDQPYTGKAATTATFSEPGEYLLHVTANDYSGNGGGGAGCCWTTALVKVAVAAGAQNTTGGQ